MKFIALLLISFFTSIGFSQSSELVFLRGKVISSDKSIENVNVFNLRSEASTSSNEQGNYTLFVKLGDTLKFSSLQVETKKIVIQKEDLAKSLVVTSLVSKMIALEEVEVKNYKNINALSLGILQKPAKQYTPAERRLNTASKSHPVFGIGNFIGFSAGLDPVLNWMSGRTTMLKKEVTVEKKEILLQKIAQQYEDDFFITTLKIPKEYINGFCYYAVEDEKLAISLRANNKAMTTFILTDLSKQYKEVLQLITK
jgi:hypothetical protein